MESIKKQLRRSLKTRSLYESSKPNFLPACANDIIDDDIPILSISNSDYTDVQSRISAIISRELQGYYIGTTSNYQARFCPDLNAPNSPISKNAHAHKYDKMYVLGKSFFKAVISYFEEKLIEDFSDADNQRDSCFGLKEAAPPYYLYIVIQE